MISVRYEVTGELQAPKDFSTYVSPNLLSNRTSHISASQINLDEFSSRRGVLPKHIEFEIVFEEMHKINNGDDGYFLSGTIQDGEYEGAWILVEVTDRVRFDILT